MARIGFIGLLSVVVIVVLAVLVAGFDFRADRMNFPPGVSRTVILVVSNVTGNVTITVPGNFTVTNASAGGNATTANVTWLSLTDATVNMTMTTPSTCTENDLFRSNVYVNGTLNASFPYICLPDSKIVDFKMEYGHGNANYLGIGDELVIPNRSAVLFNLVRVFNLGYLLTPNQNPENASLYCQYELLPVRTYGSGEVARGSAFINMSYFWSEIRGGFWFRIGVLSQDFTPRPPGTSYNVTCHNLTYQFAHTRVSAPFTNYSFSVRTEYPFTISQFNDTEFLGSNLYLLQNTETYTAHKVKIVFSQANQTAVFEHPRMAPGDFVVFRVLNSTTTNLSVFFVPSWFAHSTDPSVLMQGQFFGTPPIVVNNTPPRIYFPGNQTAIVGSRFNMTVNASDPEGSDITLQDNSTLFNITSSGRIEFWPVIGQVGNHSILVNATDNQSQTNSTIFTLEVRQGTPPSDANLSRAGLGPSEGNRSTNFSLVADITNVSGAQFGNRNGTLNYSFGAINAHNQGDAVATGLIIGQGFVALNATDFDGTFNQSATLTFFNTECPHDEKPIVSFVEFAANLSLIQGTGRDCVSVGACGSASCRTDGNGVTNVTMTVNHFTSFAAFGNANLTIANTGPRGQREEVVFNATYINRSSGALIQNAQCNISIGDDPSTVVNMTGGAVVYSYVRRMDTAGTFRVNITCARPGVTTIGAIDNVTILAPVVSGGAGGGERGMASGAGRAPAGPKVPVEACVEQWECTPWTPCIGGDRRRTCHDASTCGTRNAMPLELEPCQAPVPVINVTFKATCTDGVRNQGEEGIDCAGPCPRRCPVRKEPEPERPAVVAEACGDGVCHAQEECSCPKDCGPAPDWCPAKSRTALFAVLLVLLLILAALVYKLPKGRVMVPKIKSSR